MSQLLTFRQVEEILGAAEESKSWADHLKNWFYQQRRSSQIFRGPTLPIKMTRRKGGGVYAKISALEVILENELQEFERGAKRAKRAMRNLRSYQKALSPKTARAS